MNSRWKKISFISLLILVLLGSGIFYWRYYFVFSEGVKAGHLNYFEKKGYLFKTWEGRIVQEGFKSPMSGSIESNEFRFSTENEEVAAILERSGGKLVELRYKEFLHPIPWRGASKHVIVEVLGNEKPVPNP
jgi:hypothetical protein